METPRLCTKPVARVRHYWLRCSTGRYSGCTKIPSATVFSPSPGELRCTLRNGTPSIQGTTETPRLFTEAMSGVLHPWSGYRVGPYGGRTKIPFAPVCSHGLFKCHARWRNRTPSVHRATETPRLRTEPVAIVGRQRSGYCTGPCSKCTKILLVPVCFPGIDELPCTLTESYTQCSVYDLTTEY